MTSKKPTFSAIDIERWKRVYSRDPDVLRVSISAGVLQQGYQFVELSRAHEYLGLIAVAEARYQSALSQFSDSVRAVCALLSALRAGEPIDGKLLEWSSSGFLMGSASADEEVIRQLAHLHAQAVPGCDASASARYAVTLRNLVVRDHEAAIGSWQSIKARASNRWEEAVAAIVMRDEAAFRDAMLSIEDWWKTRIRSERLQKYPDAVCDHYGFGWLRLAERAWGKRPDVVIGGIPLELFEASKVKYRVTPRIIT